MGQVPLDVVDTERARQEAEERKRLIDLETKHMDYFDAVERLGDRDITWLGGARAVT